jgi:hypothetical protein
MNKLQIGFETLKLSLRESGEKAIFGVLGGRWAKHRPALASKM